MSFGLLIHLFTKPDYLNVKKREDHGMSIQSITALGDNKTYIISAYYDSRRSKSVRVLAIIHESVKELYCWFHCAYKDHVLVTAQIDLHQDRFGFRYGTADLLCEEPPDCIYEFVSVHWSKTRPITSVPRFEVKNRVVGPFSVNFTVCISAIYGEYNNVLQMIQSFEMYKLLGANRVTIYKNGCHENVEKVLQYYVKEGFLDVVTWPIDRYLRTSNKWLQSRDPKSQVGYYGQSAVLNDCMYRNMYRSKFVLLNDIDEIILPTKHLDWESLMSTLQEKYPQTSVFRIENHFFTRFLNDSEGDMWNDIPGVNILLHTSRLPINPAIFNSRKMIINPRQVFQTSIHKVLKADGKSTDVSIDDVILFHCKNIGQPKLANETLIEDNTIVRYHNRLEQKVDNAIHNIHWMHKCWKFFGYYLKCHM
ncbi:beta-1,4-galactosyltransferase galt-1-like [Bombina bombina]|uniref:beta-1,4-galactosyltransferase galt-1-like n=1 Tax=Bombina bombina TaxID=8345 RepID=UPI00235A4F29|nr:beta-1,4-galactosyltransferase galt-1-like [Bombina bombina]